MQALNETVTNKIFVNCTASPIFCGIFNKKYQPRSYVDKWEEVTKMASEINCEAKILKRIDENFKKIPWPKN